MKSFYIDDGLPLIVFKARIINGNKLPPNLNFSRYFNPFSAYFTQNYKFHTDHYTKQCNAKYITYTMIKALRDLSEVNDFLKL